MDDEAKKELTSILAAYRERLHESEERTAKAKNDRAAFVESFRSLKTERIAPALEEFVVQMNEAGHQASIVDQQEASDRNGQFTPASMALRIVPLRVGDMASAAASSRIEVTFSANQQTMKVLVSSSHNANGAIGKRGDYELPELTKEFVQANVLKTIREAFAMSK